MCCVSGTVAVSLSLQDKLDAGFPAVFPEGRLSSLPFTCNRTRKGTVAKMAPTSGGTDSSFEKWTEHAREKSGGLILRGSS